MSPGDIFIRKLNSLDREQIGMLAELMYQLIDEKFEHQDFELATEVCEVAAEIVFPEEMIGCI